MTGVQTCADLQSPDIRRSLVKARRGEPPVHVCARFVLPSALVDERVRATRLPGESYTQVVTRTLVEQTFAACPELSIVGVQLAVDLHDSLGIKHRETGNFTGLIAGYVTSGARVGDEVARLFESLRKGAALGFSKLLSLSRRGTANLSAWLAGQFRAVLFARGDLMMDHLFLVSNLGQVSGEYLRRGVGAISLRTTTPHVYVSVSALNGLTAVEVSYPSNVYDEAGLTRVMDRFVACLQGKA